MTYNALLKDMEETAPHEHQNGRKTTHRIENMLGKGIQSMLLGANESEVLEIGSGPGAEGGIDAAIEAEDVNVDED